MRPPIIDGENPLVESDVVVVETRAAILSRRHQLSGAASTSIMDLADDPFVSTGPAEIADYWAAADDRDGEPVNYGVEAWSVSDVLRGVGYQDNVITSFPSILRFFNVPGLVAVPL